MTEVSRESEALRRALYRPGASAEDVDSYLAVAVDAAPPRAAGAGRAAPRSSDVGRRLLAAAAAAAVVALVAGALASGALEAPVPSAAPIPATPTSSAARPAATITIDPGTGRIVPLPTVVDRGFRRSAMGTAVRMGVGQYLYTVAAGDTVSGIAQRFRLCDADVLVSLPYGFDAGAIPPGKQLLLSRAAAAGMCRSGGVRG
jgi:nucleoid-associated protein YgaU